MYVCTINKDVLSIFRLLLLFKPGEHGDDVHYYVN